jgi:hypothetical protein
MTAYQYVKCNICDNQLSYQQLSLRGWWQIEASRNDHTKGGTVEVLELQKGSEVHEYAAHACSVAHACEVAKLELSHLVNS